MANCCISALVWYFSSGIDLHTRNLVFTIAPKDNIPEQDFIKRLGTPDIGHVRRKDGCQLDPGIPEYIVRPARTHSCPLSGSIKIVDFGEAFSQENVPQTLHTPLSVRAPEVIFGGQLDYRVDLWSLGCMVGLTTIIVFTHTNSCAAIRAFCRPATI